MKRKSRSHIVLVAGHAYCDDETIRGAIDYIAGHPDLDLDIRPLPQDRSERSLCLLLRDVDGILMTGSSMKNTIARRAAPCVFMRSQAPFVTPSVNLDEAAIGRLAAEHLLSRGYRQFVTIPVGIPARMQGFKQVVTAAGLSVHHHEVPKSDWSVFDATCRRDLQRIITTHPYPFGLFTSDYQACYVINTARLLDIAIPEQIGVVGIDNDPKWCKTAKVGLSSVQVPFFEVGRLAAQTLHDLMRGKQVPPSQVLAPVKVVARASTDAFVTADPIVAKAQRFIESNRTRNVRVPEAARVTGCSRLTLEHHFARALDIAPADYIRRRRIEHAKELLRDGGLNVDQVADACGFKDTAHFSKTCKQVTGLSPIQFRPK